MNGIIIKIPVKPYLKKFIIRKLKITNDIIPITTTDILGFGIYIMNTLTRKTNYYVNTSPVKIGKFLNSLDKDCTINLELSGAVMNSCGYIITEEKIFYINKFIEKHFRNELCIFLFSASLYNARFVVEYGMKDFLGHYNIPEDALNKSTMIKFYQRNKNVYSYISC